MRLCVKVEPTEECNPDFAPETELQEGFECNSYLLVAFDENENPCMRSVEGVSLEMLSRALRSETEVDALIMGASVIADAQKKALGIVEEAQARSRRKKFKAGIASAILESLLGDVEDDDE